MNISIKDYRFSIFYNEIECEDRTFSAIKYIANRPDTIKKQEDIYNLYTKITVDRKNGTIELSSANNITLIFNAVNRAIAMSSDRQYMAFTHCDVELLFSKETMVLEAIVNTPINGTNINRRYRSEIKDGAFNINTINMISMSNGDEIVLSGQLVFCIRLTKIPKEISLEFQHDIIEEVNKEISKVANNNSGLHSSIMIDNDLDKIAIIACNNNWVDIFKACMETKSVTKKTLDMIMRMAIKNSNMEIAKLCLY